MSEYSPGDSSNSSQDPQTGSFEHFGSQSTGLTIPSYNEQKRLFDALNVENMAKWQSMGIVRVLEGLLHCESGGLGLGLCRTLVNKKTGPPVTEDYFLCFAKNEPEPQLYRIVVGQTYQGLTISKNGFNSDQAELLKGQLDFLGALKETSVLPYLSENLSFVIHQ